MIDELRGFAILLILVDHVCGVTGFPDILHGDLGVDIFVMLSGVALAMNDRPTEGTGNFLGRRLVRLLPAYWIALTVYAFANQHFLRIPVDAKSLIVHYLCLHGMWGDRYIVQYNDSFWFMALIVLLYVAFAAMRKLLDRMDIYLCIGLVLSFVTAVVTFKAGQPSTYVHLGLRPSIFFIGVPFGLLLRHGKVRIPMTVWLGIGVVASLYGMFAASVLVPYTMCGFSLLIGYFAARASVPALDSSRACRALGVLGLYSYEIFLIHQPLIREYNGYWQVVGRWIGIPEEFAQAWGIVMGLGLTWVLATRLHRLCHWISGRLLKLMPAGGGERSPDAGALSAH